MILLTCVLSKSAAPGRPGAVISNKLSHSKKDSDFINSSREKQLMPHEASREAKTFGRKFSISR